MKTAEKQRRQGPEFTHNINDKPETMLWQQREGYSVWKL